MEDEVTLQRENVLNREFENLLRKGKIYVQRLPPEDWKRVDLWVVRIVDEGTTLLGMQRRNTYMNRLVFGMRNSYLPLIFQYAPFPTEMPLPDLKTATNMAFDDMKLYITESVEGFDETVEAPELEQYFYSPSPSPGRRNE